MKIRITSKPEERYGKYPLRATIEFKIDDKEYWYKVMLQTDEVVSYTDTHIEVNAKGKDSILYQLMYHKFREVKYTAKYYPEKIIWNG